MAIEQTPDLSLSRQAFGDNEDAYNDLQRVMGLIQQYLTDIENNTIEQDTKLNGIEAGAEVNNISDADATDLTDSGVTTLHSH